MDGERVYYGAGNNRKLWRFILIAATVAIFVGGGILFFLLRSSDPASENVQQPESSPSEQAEEQLEVTLQGLSSGQIITENTTIQIETDNDARVGRVEFYIDGVFAGVVYGPPFHFVLDLPKLSSGSHTVLAKVYDQNGTIFETEEIDIEIKKDGQQTGGQTSGSGGGTSVSTTPSDSQGGSSQPSGGNGNQGGGGSGSSDTNAPTAPSNLMLSADDGYTTDLTWSTSTDNVGVTGYRVYRDGAVLGTSTGTAYQDQTVVPGNTYDYAVRALDAANNESGFSNEPSITLVTTSIWINGDAPREFNSGFSSELGVKFRPLVNGKITGIKFYKGATDTGTHVGNLWTIGGVKLADVTFTGETATGWQQAAFSTPVDVTVGTTYVASRSSPNGGFGFTTNYFTSAGITSQYLTALATGVEGGNGVAIGTPGAFPNQVFTNDNYWVDVMFTPNPLAGGPDVQQADNSVVYPGFPGSNNTGVPIGKRLPVRDRGIDVYQPNITIENIHINGGAINVFAANALVRNTKIVDGSIGIDGASYSLTVEDSEVDAGTIRAAAISNNHFTIRRSNLHGGQTGAQCGGDCTVEDSWIHGQYTPPDEDWHLDAILSNGGSNMTFSDNTVNCDSQGNLVGGGCTAAIGLFGDFAPVTDVTVDGNFFIANEASSYCLYGGYQDNKPFGLDAANITVTNNIFQKGSHGTCGDFGHVTNYLYNGNPAPGNVWSNNTWDDGTIAPEG